jgi:Flp pilus assembly protein TadG
MRTAGADLRPVERERGSILPFTVIVVACLLAGAGLAVDGGRILAARREASSLAAEAARRASQELAWSGLANGDAVIDPERAVAAAQAFVGQAGERALVQATPQQVSVTVTITESTVLLGAFGVGPKTVTATRSAAPFTGGVSS